MIPNTPGTERLVYKSFEIAKARVSSPKPNMISKIRVQLTHGLRLSGVADIYQVAIIKGTGVIPLSGDIALGSCEQFKRGGLGCTLRSVSKTVSIFGSLHMGNITANNCVLKQIYLVRTGCRPLSCRTPSEIDIIYNLLSDEKLYSLKPGV